MADITLEPSLAALADRYDGFIVDQWGVLHDGARPYPRAIACLERLRDHGKRVVILSNSGKRADANRDEMVALGFSPRLWDAIITSGEEVWRHLKRRTDPWYGALGCACLPLSGEHCTLVRGLEVSVVDRVEDAEFILNTGLHPQLTTLSDYEPLLTSAIERGLPMVCANPDLMWVSASGTKPGPGLVARRYEALGGTVRYHGKPHPSIYECCFEALVIADHRRVLAVGDSLDHDVAGAVGAEIDSVLIAGGVHAEALGIKHGESPATDRINELCPSAGVRPTFVLSTFAW